MSSRPEWRDLTANLFEMAGPMFSDLARRTRFSTWKSNRRGLLSEISWMIRGMPGFVFRENRGNSVFKIGPEELRVLSLTSLG